MTLEDFASHVQAMARTEAELRARIESRRDERTDQSILRELVEQLRGAAGAIPIQGVPASTPAMSAVASAAAPAAPVRPATTAPNTVSIKPPEPSPKTNGRAWAEAAAAKQSNYAELIADIRKVAAEYIPGNATVAVVSKGDDKLLDLGGPRCWHMPQAEGGVYAGHHPADGQEVVSQVEALRKKGAQYLLLPATMFWWLQYYPEFHRHLNSNYRLAHAERSCAIYLLTDGSGEGRIARQAEYNRVVRLVRATISEVVPAGGKFLVVSRGDANLLDVENRVGWHFPRSESGMWAGHHPANSEDAIAHLDLLLRQGAQYVVFPGTAFWWLDHYKALREHLETAHRCAVRNDNCVIYRLAVPVRAAAAEAPATKSPTGTNGKPAATNGKIAQSKPSPASQLSPRPTVPKRIVEVKKPVEAQAVQEPAAVELKPADAAGSAVNDATMPHVAGSNGSHKGKPDSKRHGRTKH